MNFTIRLKLYGLGFIGLAFSLAVGLTGLYGISRVAAGIQDVTSTSSAIRNHMEASMFLDLTRSDVSKMMTASGDAQETAASELAEHETLLHDRMAAAVSFTRNAEAALALHQESAAVGSYLQKASQIGESRKDLAAVTELLGAFLQDYQDLRNTMDGVNDKLQGASKRSETEGESVVNRSKLGIIAICMLSSLALFVLAFLTARNVNRRLAVIIEWLKQMAAGDLTLQIQDASRDELGEIARWFNDSMEKLRGAIARVASSASSVTTATRALTEVSKQMSTTSEATTNQANIASSETEKVSQNLQTVATGTEEMSASLREIAKSVNEAARVANDAVKVAHSTNRMIAKLGESSAEIGQVVKVITSIAQQTNLLALNATIEAA